MKRRRIGAIAMIVAGIAAILHFASRWLITWMSVETLPQWAVVSTTGVTIGIYSTMMIIGVTSVTIALAVGAGYYIGRDVNVLAEYRRLIGVFVGGSAIGTFGIYTGLMVYVRETVMPTTPVGWGRPVMHLLNYISVFSEIGLVVTVAMFAGAALCLSEREVRGTMAIEASADDTTPSPNVEQLDDADLRSDPA